MLVEGIEVILTWLYAAWDLFFYTKLLVMFKDFVIAAVLTESARLVNQRREGTRLGLRLLHYKMCQPSRRMCFPFLTLNDLEQTFRV